MAVVPQAGLGYCTGEGSASGSAAGQAIAAELRGRRRPAANSLLSVPGRARPRTGSAYRARAARADGFAEAGRPWPQSQEEFDFSLPYDAMDLCLFGRNNGVPVADIATATSLTSDQVHRVFRDIDQKRRTTQYLQLGPELSGDVPEISHKPKL